MTSKLQDVNAKLRKRNMEADVENTTLLCAVPLMMDRLLALEVVVAAREPRAMQALAVQQAPVPLQPSELPHAPQPSPQQAQEQPADGAVRLFVEIPTTMWSLLGTCSAVYYVL